MSRWSQWKSKLGVEKRGKERSRSPVSPDPALEAFPSGIKVLNEPLDATADIVFVHGITGDRERTWTSPVNAVCWPRDLLPTSLPDARILTFGYDAYVAGRQGNIARLDISHHANDLLNALANERQTPALATRPIIFVAHSLGGLLCKDAIRRSETSRDRHLRAIASSTRGIAFVATPHGGSWLAAWAKIPATILGFVTRTDLSLLALLQSNSEVLSRIHDDFLSLVRRRESEHTPIEVACFYETLSMFGGSQIVDQSSATIPGFNNISIHADHRDVARFPSAQQPGYRSLVGILERWAGPVQTDTRLSPDAEAFLETLSFREMGVRQAIIEPAESGTCLWILRHPAYEAWINCQDVDRSHGLLWVKGKPGSGKSTLLKHIASGSPTSKGVVRLVFFFNARGAEEERNAGGLFKTFLHQLVHESPAIRRRLLTLFRKKKTEAGPGNIVWNPAELREMFFDTLRASPDTHIEIFVDALDECRDDEVHAIVSAFERCAADHITKGSHNLKICWSSRHYPHISIDHGFELRVEAMNLEDIELYVDRHLRRSERGEILGALRSEIVSKSQGVFLWSVLVVNKISRLADRGFPLTKIEKVVRDLPSELSKLYAEIISTLDPDLAEDATNLLYLTLYAERPLDTDELRLGIEFMKGVCPHSLEQFASLCEQVSYFQLFITECSGGLLEVVDSGIHVGQPVETLEEALGVEDDMRNFVPESVWQKSHRKRIATIERQYINPGSKRKASADVETRWIVQVIHETVRDFFVKHGKCQLPGQMSPLSMDPSVGNFRLYQMCSHILATDEMSCLVRDRTRQTLFKETPHLVKLASKWRGTSIVSYAVDNVFFHLKTSLFSSIQQSGVIWASSILDLQREALSEAITQTILRWICIREYKSDDLGRDTTKRYGSTSGGYGVFGFDIIEDEHLQPILDSLGLKAGDFQVCAEEGHMCLLTLYRRSVQLQGIGNTLSSTLSAVAHHGTEEEMACVLSQVDTKALEIIGIASPLLMALNSRKETIVDILIAKGDSMNACWTRSMHETLFRPAVLLGNAAVVQRLLQHGNDPNYTKRFDCAPLIDAASLGYANIVQLLLHSGADVLACDSHNNTAYEVAVQNGHLDVVEILKTPTIVEQRLRRVREKLLETSNRQFSTDLNITNLYTGEQD